MKKLFAVMVIMSGFIASGALVSQPAFAATGLDEARSGANKVQTGGENSRSVNQILRTVTNVLLFIIGAISVIMIIVGGIRYTTSNGDANRVTAAKNTIMYAIVGLVVAIVAYAIVDFVIDQL